MRTILYNECSDYFSAGLLKPPADPDLIWTFCSARRDHFPAPDLRNFKPAAPHPVGYYLNLGFRETGAHLAEAESPWKMERNYRMVEANGRGPLAFSVVNVGNVREFLLTASANAEMLWNFNGFNADGFLHDFCARYWTAEHADLVAALYRDFFSSYWRQRQPDLPGFEDQYLFQDFRIRQAGVQLLKQLKAGDADPNQFSDRDKGYFRIVPADCGAASQLDAVIQGAEASAAKLRAVVTGCDDLAGRLPEQGRTFFNDHLRLQAHFMLEANRWLAFLARAVKALPEKEQSRRQIAGALRAAEAMWAALDAAQHDEFKDWFAGDTYFGVKKLRDTTAALLR
jgi:hypothetical protein